jgi:hypothetical protein
MALAEATGRLPFIAFHFLQTARLTCLGIESQSSELEDAGFLNWESGDGSRTVEAR